MTTKQGQADISPVSGLPCRKNCGWRLDVTPLGQSDKTAFALFCRARIDHELKEHDYVHEAVPIAKARYDWGRSSRQVMRGQGI